MEKFKLGLLGEDKITGFKGIITGHSAYITGCDQYVLQPLSKDSADFKEGRWFDEGRIKIIGNGILKEEVQAEKNGCDQTAPVK